MVELNVIQLSIRTKKNACSGQSELKANTRKPPDAREKRVTNSRWVQFSFASDWLRGQSEFLDQSIHYWSTFGISFKMLKQSSADRVFLSYDNAGVCQHDHERTARAMRCDGVRCCRKSGIRCDGK